MLDVKLYGGTVIDGSGAPRRRASVGIRGGRIVEVGEIAEPARETIDATGKIVCPGFVDLHTHYDAQVFWDPSVSPSSFHGVTTVVGGNCGFSIAPLSPEAAEYLRPMLARVEGMPLESLRVGVPWSWHSFGEYLDLLEGRLAINAGFLAGHCAIRRVAMGERAVGYEATPAELARMKQLLGESLEQGALGFSSTISVTHNDADGRPVPSRHASREELLELAGVVGDHEGTTLEFLPGIPPFREEQKKLMADLSLAARRPLNWNVLIATVRGAAQVEDQLQTTNYARSRGAEVVALTVPQAMTVRINLRTGFVFDAFHGWAELFRLPPALRMERLRDRATRERLDRDARSEESGNFRALANWPRMRLVEGFSAESKRHEGRMIGEIAADLGKEPFDTLLDLALADELKTSFMPPEGRDDRGTWEMRGRLWHDDRTVIGASDAGAHLDMIDTFAQSTQVLGNGVRKHGVIALEEAVRQLTQVPAELYGLRERGLLREGWHADVVVFDADTVETGPTHMRFDLPGGAGRLYADARGIEQVLVGGVRIVDEGRYTGATPGTVLRSGRDTRTVAIAAGR